MKRKLLVATFAIYLVVVAFLTIVPTRLSRLQDPHSDHVNLIPFEYSFKCVLVVHRRHPDLMTGCLRNTIGNLLLLAPFGFLLPLINQRFGSITKVILTAACLSLSIEFIQFILRFVGSGRAVDIDDVLLNTLGACLGYAIYRICTKQ